MLNIQKKKSTIYLFFNRLDENSLYNTVNKTHVNGIKVNENTGQIKRSNLKKKTR